MTSEVLGNTPVEQGIVRVTIDVGGKNVVISTVGGKPYREEGKGAVLGKRYSCGQEGVVLPTNEPTGVTDQTPVILSGLFTDKDGATFNLGCGTTVLCSKAGPVSPSCCDMPMTLTQPRKLPSSD